MKALRARRSIRRANWAIAASVAAVVVLRCAEQVRVRSASDADGGDLERSRPAPPAPGGGLEAFLVSLRRFHPVPPPPPALKAAPEDDPDAPLPLIVYRLAMFVDSHDGNSTAMIASKDPGRRLTHHLRQGVEVDGIVLRRLEVSGDSATALIERGPESALLTMETGSTGSARIVAAAPAHAPQAIDVGAPVVALADSVRCVPYFDSAGKAIGLRVTGVLASSPLTKAGLSVGDAIVSLDDEVVTSPATLMSRLRDGWRPRELAVLRSSDEMKTRSTIRLR